MEYGHILALSGFESLFGRWDLDPVPGPQQGDSRIRIRIRIRIVMRIHNTD
jgi:hypothetical protein